jgi:D-xylose transport system permease protein
MSLDRVKNESALLKSKEQQSFDEYMRAYWSRVRGGDLGNLPIIIGIIIIAILFQSQNANFLTARNLVNLFVQMSIFTVIGYGIVFVLLLGEIDLSAGYTAGVSAVIIGQLLSKPIALPTELAFLANSTIGETTPAFTATWYGAIAVALGIATLIGFVQGTIVTFFQLPSFIVTLAGQLAWSGTVLLLMGGAGTVNLQNATVRGVTQSFFPPEVGWAVGIGAVLVFIINEYFTYTTRRRLGLAGKPPQVVMIQSAIVAVLVLGVVFICNQDRGVPFAGIIVLIIMGLLTYLTTKTKFGRYLFAVGGNKEAARRAGIPVERIRTLGFMLCSLMAGIGGIFLVARLGSVAPDAGGGQLLLNSIAAPVIGGTSLYGGSGKISSAFFGALIIASVDNGMFLLGLGAGQRLILTALVLLAAVIVDALARRSKAQSGIR